MQNSSRRWCVCCLVRAFCFIRTLILLIRAEPYDLITSFILIFYSFYKLTTFSPPCPLPTHPPTPLTDPHPPSRKGKASDGESTKSGTSSGAGPSPLPCIKAVQGIPPYGMASKKPVHTPGIDPSPTAREGLGLLKLFIALSFQHNRFQRSAYI